MSCFIVSSLEPRSMDSQHWTGGQGQHGLASEDAGGEGQAGTPQCSQVGSPSPRKN